MATRAALLAAARLSFGERGFAGASLAEIAGAARATTGALYHHFADKKALFAAVAEDIEAELVEALVRSLPRTADPWELVRYSVTETLALTATPGIANVIFRDAPNVLGATAWSEIEMRYGYGRLHELLRTIAARGRLAGDPAIVAGIILGALTQTVDAVVTSPDPASTLTAGKAAMLRLVDAFRA